MPVFDRKELNKIFKGEHSAVSRDCQLKIFCGEPGLGRGAGRRQHRVTSQGCPFLVAGRELRGPPTGQQSAIGAGPHLQTQIIPETECGWQLSALSLPALCDFQNPDSSPEAQDLSQNRPRPPLSSCPASWEAQAGDQQRRWQSG